jgi:precorrin-6B methylase 2
MKVLKNKYQKIAFLLKNRQHIKLVLNNFFEGYLYETGWSRSVIEGKPVDKDGNPLPWISIPTIELLKEKDLSQLFVFEYGAGNSTIWFSKRVKKVVSIEHDKEWFAFVQKMIDAKNSKVYFKELSYGGDYARSILDYNEVDIALVDGRDRVNCAKNSVTQLSSKGVIILDDAQRENYQEAIEYIQSKGFKSLNLVGMNVGRPMRKVTTIFYRDNNCLGL